MTWPSERSCTTQSEQPLSNAHPPPPGVKLYYLSCQCQTIPPSSGVNYRYTPFPCLGQTLKLTSFSCPLETIPPFPSCVKLLPPSSGVKLYSLSLPVSSYTVCTPFPFLCKTIIPFLCSLGINYTPFHAWVKLYPLSLSASNYIPFPWGQTIPPPSPSCVKLLPHPLGFNYTPFPCPLQTKPLPLGSNYNPLPYWSKYTLLPCSNFTPSPFPL